MADNQMSENGRSSVPAERSSPQLSASVVSVGGDSNLQSMGDVLKRNPATSITTVSVGPAEERFEVSEDHMKRIPCFGKILHENTFREGKEGRLRLPKDDPSVFDRVVQFIRTGDYSPHIVLLPEQCDDPGYCYGLFQHQHRLQDREPGCERRYDASRCGSLESTLEIIIDLESDTKAPYHHRDPQFGRWKTTDDTHELFEREVLLFCMAEKFLMEDLKKLCLSKILMFPLGPRELAVLAKHVPAKVYEPNVKDLVNTEMHQLLLRCIRYHQQDLDDWRANGRFRQESVCGYDDYVEVIESQMTPHGAMLFHAMADARNAVERSVGEMYALWECRDEHIAVCQSDYTASGARFDLARRAWRRGEDVEGATPKVQNLDHLYPGFEFCKARPGDTIIRITRNKPIRGFAYGLNVRADRWGWYPCDMLRFLETKSYKNCGCHQCQPPTFKVNGHGQRLYMHDPEGKGLDYRPGTRQTDLEKGRKFREA